MNIRQCIGILLTSLLCIACQNHRPKETVKVRHQEDTIGFAQHAWQLDSILARIAPEDKRPTDQIYKAVISPHDDYAYAGGLYTKTLAGIKAKTIVLIGVAHGARDFDLENHLIFGSFQSWSAPGGPIPVSSLRDELLQEMQAKNVLVHDAMMQQEHSLEAITPFLQKQNPEIEIIPILVPYATFEMMHVFSNDLATSLHTLMEKYQLQYGEDLAIVISNDAIHYGSEGWGGKDLAPFGTDSIGNARAHQKDERIIKECLEGQLTLEKVRQFNTYTIMPDNFKEYNWTWCGRYSTPLGLLTANKLSMLTRKKPLVGTKIDYRSSLYNDPIAVEDIGMGHTAPATNTHWVAYVGMAYE
ncbi:MAG: AmmeMemoRadiSam system protein B [Flavobacteriales bacterium]|jgi:AmmeMemoRadiSam system protein B